MDSYMYICNYCYEPYVPKRRHAQKYCNNSCRSKAYHIRQRDKLGANKVGPDVQNSQPAVEPDFNPMDKITLSSVGSATIGTLAADGIKAIFTPEGNRPATKSDVWALAEYLKRYHKINNMASKTDGRIAHFDLETKEIVYFWPWQLV